jgi:hypothetical protein
LAERGFTEKSIYEVWLEMKTLEEEGGIDPEVCKVFWKLNC